MVTVDVNGEVENNLIRGPKTSYYYEREGVEDIALITMVKNEEDIIFENLAWHFVMGFRKFVIADNLSTDSTREKIEYFKNLTENKAVVFVIDDPIFEYIQSRITTAEYNLVRSVWPEVKWIFPVDADEFWISRTPVNSLFKKLGDSEAVKSKASKYFPSYDYSSFEANSTFYQKIHCYESNPIEYHYKSAFNAKNDLEIDQGNHSAKKSKDKKEIHAVDGNNIGLEIREFHIRSPEHAAKKFYNSMLANLSAKEKKLIKSDVGTHWDQYQQYINKYGDKA